MRGLLKIALALVVAPAWAGPSLTPDEVLRRFLSGPGDTAACPASFDVQIDAYLPKLRKMGGMTGTELVLPTGEVAYRDIRFTGDHVVKTSVITRYLSKTAEAPRRSGTLSISRQNYFITYQRISDYNGNAAYVFHLKPRWKRVGLLKGELWIDANTGRELRVWGDLNQSPSIFVRDVRLVQDYQQVSGCAAPLRLIVNVDTRLAGEADMVVWLHPSVNTPAAEAAASESAATDRAAGGQ